MSLDHGRNFINVDIDRQFRDDLRLVIHKLQESNAPMGQYQFYTGKLVGMVGWIANLRFEGENYSLEEVSNENCARNG